MAQITGTLLPIFAIIALGGVLRSSKFASPVFFRETNRLVYWVAIPAYLFYKTAEATLAGVSAVRVSAVVLGGMLASIGIGYLAARLLRLPGPGTGALVQGAYRGNLAYIGLPVAVLALAAAGRSEPGLEAAAVIALAVSIPAYNVAAVLILVGSQGAGTTQRRPRAGQFIVRLVTNPLLMSCVAGLAVLAAGWSLPAPVRTALKTVGDMNTPLALLGIGASLSFSSLRAHWRNAGLATLIKLVASPLVGLALAAALGLHPGERLVALIFLACPTAAASYVMAQQLGADEQLAANIIVISTMLSAIALGTVLALT